MSWKSNSVYLVLHHLKGKLMFDYFLHPERVIKPRGNLEELTYICPQAFGRNTWKDADISNRIRRYRARTKKLYPEDIDIFKELEVDHFDPGLVNDDLASQCFWLSTGGAPSLIPRTIIGQWEVLYALWQMHKNWYEENRQYFTAIWPPADGRYLTTRGLLKESRSLIDKAGGIVIVAQAVHAARCVRLAGKIFGNHRVIVPHLGRAQYDKRSVQEWTRSEKNFLAWERKARIFEELPAPARWLAQVILGK